jgi:multimeric flavodoxin WrbA
MKIAALIGGPREDGNSTRLLEAAAAAAEERGHVANMMFLRNMSIRPCIACGGCRRGPSCVVLDHMTRVYDAIRMSDALLVSTPVYFHTMSAFLKGPIDRLYALLRPDGSPRVTAGKALYVIVTQEYTDTTQAESTARLIEEAFAYIGATPAGSLVAGGLVNPDDYVARPELLEAARALIP